jgi:hypothetical protein
VRVEHIGSSILFLRGQRVIIDADLAALYGVRTTAIVAATILNSPRAVEMSVFVSVPSCAFASS